MPKKEIKNFSKGVTYTVTSAASGERGDGAGDEEDIPREVRVYGTRIPPGKRDTVLPPYRPQQTRKSKATPAVQCARSS